MGDNKKHKHNYGQGDIYMDTFRNEKRKQKIQNTSATTTTTTITTIGRRGIGVVLIPAVDELGVRFPRREVIVLVQTTL